MSPQDPETGDRHSSSGTAATDPGRRRWGGLSGKLLLLTVVFVMLAEVLIFLPSVGIGQMPLLPGGIDPLAFAIFLSLSLNTLAFVGLSIFGFPDPVERLQGLSFVSAVYNLEQGRGLTPSPTPTT